LVTLVTRVGPLRHAAHEERDVLDLDVQRPQLVPGIFVDVLGPIIPGQVVVGACDEREEEKVWVTTFPPALLAYVRRDVSTPSKKFLPR
jgi:hypothetical protein